MAMLFLKAISSRETEKPTLPHLEIKHLAESLKTDLEDTVQSFD